MISQPARVHDINKILILIEPKPSTEDGEFPVVAEGNAIPIGFYDSSKVKEILGETQVQGLLFDDGSKLEVSGVFIELGAKGAVELTSKLGVALDSETMQFISTNKKQETNIPGLYAARDICGLPWQVAIPHP